MRLAFPKPKDRKARALGGIRLYPGGREVCRENREGQVIYRQRTMTMAYRQKWLCALCGKKMTEETVSFDHEFGRGMGGSRRDDRIEVNGQRFNAAVHIVCNGEKGSRAVAYVLQ